MKYVIKDATLYRDGTKIDSGHFPDLMDKVFSAIKSGDTVNYGEGVISYEKLRDRERNSARASGRKSRL